MHCVATSKCWPPLSLLFIFVSLLFMSLTHSQLPSSDFFSPPASVASFFSSAAFSSLLWIHHHSPSSILLPLVTSPLLACTPFNLWILSLFSFYAHSVCEEWFAPMHWAFLFLSAACEGLSTLDCHAMSKQTISHCRERWPVRAGLLTQQNYTYHCPVLFPFYSVPHYFPQIQFHQSTFSSSLVYIISNNFHNPMKDVILNSLMVSHLF